MPALIAAIAKILSALAAIVPATAELVRNWRLIKNDEEERRQRAAVRRAIDDVRAGVLDNSGPQAGAGPDGAARVPAPPASGVQGGG